MQAYSKNLPWAGLLQRTSLTYPRYPLYCSWLRCGALGTVKCPALLLDQRGRSNVRRPPKHRKLYIYQLQGF